MKAAIQDAYALSPMQEGMLFHCLAEPGTGLYVVQQSFRLEDTDVGVLRQAFQDVVDRHAVLRTAFAWQGLEKPLQLVGRELRLPWEDLDWSSLAPDTQADRLRVFLDEDRRRGFDFSRAPLLRVAAIRTGAALELVFSFHHLLLDGWSTALLLSEVFAAYVARTSGGELPPSSARPFKDYVRWLEGRDPARSEAFWRDVLRGFDTPTPLALARPRRVGAGEASYRAVERRLSRQATQALQAFARAQGLALNTIVQGVWAIALSRYSGERDVLYGSVSAGRPAELQGSEAMLGLFINTLPVRVRVDEETELTRWLAGLQRQQGELRDHEHTPLVFAHGCSDVPRDRPLFESLLAFENYPPPKDLGASSHGPVLRRATGIESTHYPLTVAVAPGRELLLRLIYDRRRLDEPAVERVLEHLATLFTALPQGAGRPLAELPLLAAGERQRLTVDWNDTRRDGLRRPAAELVEAQARQRPESLAVAKGSERLSYGELEARANRLAHHLRSNGVGPEVRVGVCLERSPELAIALLAVLKAGAAYVPLDPAHPAERLAFMLQDAQAPVVLTREALLDRLSASGTRAICLDRDGPQIEQESGNQPALRLDPASLAYVIYTSGSTGRPKGVEVTHAGLANLVAWHRRAYSLVPEDRTTLLASLSFDASVWEIWPTLAAGASLHLPDDATRTAPAALVSWLVEQDITLSFLPTPLAEAVLQEPWPEIGSALRALLTGGDRLHPLAPRERSFRIVNHYGPTEATVVATAGAVDPLQDAGEPPIGRPIDNTRVYVLDTLGRPVPQGVPGELYIGGDGLARGYLRRPELTAERFVPDPFSSEPGARLYRTGDHVRHLEDGRLEFLGRADEQVKIRGFRVELAEIEAALAAHPAVREAALVAGDDGTGGLRLLAYATLRPGAALTMEEVARFLASRLPDHMVPSAFEVLEAIPLTANGKIDRRALGQREAPQSSLAQGEAPRTPVEQALAEIWAGVLGLRHVGIHDDFERGGHSLLATRVVGQVRKTFDVELPLRALFESPSVARLAERIEAARLAGRPQAPLVRVDREQPLPLSFAQRRLWLLDRLQPGSPAYNLAASWALDGPLDTQALSRALQEILRRHEVLRSRLICDQGEPTQQVDPATPFRIEHTDLSGLPEPGREEAARRRAGQEALRPFDLARGPLLRASLLRLAPERHVLVMTAHHVAFDGWSAGIFARELALLYRAYRDGRESPLPELTFQYADFAAWQHTWAQDGALAEQLRYWRARLAGAPALELPTDHPRPRVQTYVAGRTPIALPAELTAALRRLCRREGATLFMALVAGVQALLHRYAGQEDFVLGSPVANRVRPELEGLIGFFVNTLPLRADLRGDPSFRQLLLRVRETTLGAYDNLQAPFDRVVEELNPERDASRSPLLQAIVALQNAPAEPFDLAGLTLRPLPSDHAVTRFDLELHFVEASGGLAGLLVYNAELWEPETTARMAGHLRALLEGALARPDAPLSSLSLVGPDEQRQLAEWGQGRRAAYPESTIADEFARVAAARAEASALVEGERRVSYRELDERANRLARQLRRLGVAAEARVAVCLERSVELVVALLATLKAGGAYLPLDPGHPAEHLAFLVEDAGAVVVLTRQALHATFSGVRACVVCLEDLAASPPGDPTPVRPGTGPDNLAYVTYTSGSTGRPKGVLVTQRGVLRLLFGVDYASFGPEERLLQLAPPAFDASTFEIWGALLHGGTCVVHPEALPSAQGLADSIRRREVTTLWLTSSLFNAIVDESAPALRGLRQLLIGGEALSPEHVRRAQRELPMTRLVNGYGPTEGTTFTCCHPIPSPLPERVTSVPIGRPLANTEVFVLDDSLNALPVGVPGELCVGGDGLARGYLGRPELTAERFCPSPTGQGARLYRTGDRVRWLADGTLEFLGRADQQVKLRGHRIELGEIEAALTRLPGLREAAVTLRDDRPGDKRLVAYLVPAPVGQPDETELRAALRRTLPEYMVPAAFVLLPAFPLNANGKLDRAALPAPEATGSAGERPAPRDEVERRIAGIWCGVLGLERVGIHDNFFELGGNSLLLVRAHERLRPLFGAEPPSVVELFEYPTVATLADRLRSEGTPVVDDSPGAREERARQGRDRLERRRLKRQEAGAHGDDEAEVGA